MTVLTFQEDLLSPTLTTQHDDSDGAGVPRVFTNNGILALYDDDVVFDHVDDAAAPHDLARCNLVGARLIRDLLHLLVRQKMHICSHSFSSEREE